MLYKRISKRRARKLHEMGMTYYMQPCKMSINNPWQRPMPVTNRQDRSFDDFVNEFIHYNCDNERGYYPHYYVLE